MKTKLMRCDRPFLAIGILLATVALLGAWNCSGRPFECSDDEQHGACEAAQQLAFLAAVGTLFPNPAVPAPGPQAPAPAADPASRAPVCARTAGEAVGLSYIRVGRAPIGASCYFRFEIVYEPGAAGPFKPSFQLVPEIGNVDLYVGFDNDSTGGTIGFTGCSTSSSGGGWVRCSRNLGNTNETVSTNGTGIPAMAPGDFRIVSVYNAGSVPVDFAILGFKNGSVQ